MKLLPGRDKIRNSFPVWLRRTAVSVVIIFIGVVGLGMLNNNVSIRRPSRSEFVESLDRTLIRGTDWMLRQYPVAGPTPEGVSLISNASLAHMVVDCGSISDDPRMKALGSRFVESWQGQPGPLARIVDPSLPSAPIRADELLTLEEYQRWIMHGATPDEVPLSATELEDMFSPNQHRTGTATHQLFALYFYRRSKGSSADLDRLMNVIEQRIASEAAVDFRVTDLYLQRIAFLLAAGRPDLVRPRWMERALAAQQPDGGWLSTWHGWSRTPYRFVFENKPPMIAHSTAQGMWIACMLKYRYPDWVERNYK
jgi:hypothetical protein